MAADITPAVAAAAPRRPRRAVLPRVLGRSALLAYLGLLHAAALWAVWESELPGRVAVALGWVPDWVEFDRPYKRRVATLRRLDAVAQPGALVFLGDSHVASLDTGAVADHALNYGIGGDTTRRVIKQLDEYQALATARGFVLHVGVNDISLRPVDRFEHIYRRIVAALPADRPLVLSAIMPIDERSRRGSPNALIARYNEVIRAVCAARPGCTLVDAGPELVDGSGNLAVRFHAGDGLHLNAAGYKVWQAALREGLTPYAKLD